jgi:hypothetical protein
MRPLAVADKAERDLIATTGRRGIGKVDGDGRNL